MKAGLSCSLWLLKCSSDDPVTKWLSGSKIVSQNPITAFHKFCPLNMCPQPSEFFNLKIKAEKKKQINHLLDINNTGVP